MSELEALEREGWEALSGPNGAAFYDELMADDGLALMTSVSARRDGRWLLLHQQTPTPAG